MSESPFDESAAIAPEPGPVVSDLAAAAAAKGVLLPPVVQDELPKLRIHHIMLLTAVTAAALSSVRLFARFSSGGGPLPQDPITGGMLMVGSILVSLALTVTLLGWWWGRRQWIAFNQPGQRLALDVVGRTIAIVAFAIVATLVARSAGWSAGYQIALLLSIYGMGLAIVILELMLARSQPPRSVWRFLFNAKALLTTAYGIATLLPMLGFPGMIFSMVIGVCMAVGYVLVVLCQFVGIFRDRRQHIARHWTHWWGLAAHLGINLVITLTVVVGLAFSLLLR